MPHSLSVSISIFIGVGSRYETEAEAGVSHFIEHLLFKGTEKRPTSREISEAIEGVGGILNGGTDKELTVYWCKVAQPHFLHALEVLADMLLHRTPGYH
jgi:predicted Zn-dependent peptidase